MVQKKQKPYKEYKRGKTTTVDSHKMRRLEKYTIDEFISHDLHVVGTAMLDDDDPNEYAFYELQDEMDSLMGDVIEYRGE